MFCSCLRLMTWPTMPCSPLRLKSLASHVMFLPEAHSVTFHFMFLLEAVPTFLPSSAQDRNWCWSFLHSHFLHEADDISIVQPHTPYSFKSLTWPTSQNPIAPPPYVKHWSVCSISATRSGKHDITLPPSSHNYTPCLPPSMSGKCQHGGQWLPQDLVFCMDNLHRGTRPSKKDMCSVSTLVFSLVVSFMFPDYLHLFSVKFLIS